MKKLLLALSLFSAVSSAQASFFGSNNGEWKMGPYGPYWEENDWPEWTPMYWMQEFSDSFNDNENGNGFSFNNSFGNMPFFGGNNYNPYLAPPMPYGYGAPIMPYGAAPMPYGYAPAPMMPAPLPAPVNTAPGPSTESSAPQTN